MRLALRWTALEKIFVSGAIAIGLAVVWFSSNFFYTLFWAVLEKWNFKEASFIAYTLANLTPFILVVALIAIIYLFVRREIAKQVAGNISSPVTSTSFDRNVTVYDAICRMYLGRWDKISVADGRLDLTQNGFQAVHDLMEDVRQFAFDGRFPIWGKAQGHMALWEQTPPAFWRHHHLDYLSITDGDASKLRIVPSDTSGQITTLRDLMTSKAAVELLCQDPLLAGMFPTNDANSLTFLTGRGKRFDHVVANQHGVHHTIFVGVKNVGAKKVTNCNVYRTYLAFTNDSGKSLLDGPFSLDPNEIRYFSVAMFNETKDLPHATHLIGLSIPPGAFGAGVMVPRLPPDRRHIVTFTVESVDTADAVLHCELWIDEAGKLRLESL
jgi:hypothetical protein